MPQPDPESRETLDAELRRILQRHELDRESRGKPTRPRTSSVPKAPRVDTPEDKQEREEIRSFWGKFRNKIREGSVDTGKVDLE